MIVRSKRPDHHFSIVDNATIRDHRLSWRARGLLVYLLSMPDGWTVRSEHLAAQGTEGRDAIRSALRELEANGYLVRRKYQDAGGRWRSDSIIYDRPTLSTDLPTAEDGLPVVGKPVDLVSTNEEELTVGVTTQVQEDWG